MNYFDMGDSGRVTRFADETARNPWQRARARGPWG